ncbi:MAG: glycogenin glucosyltransferase [Heterodermia speciosa]|uniref:glycogenin glucosyltransferase n=1 Tax=Heterodermia speciosa TaxID=116794 RepID=A0A8H3ERP4_9LECA|nr:MAG: glycogenin glucosyltransferase [Heterodermia speciosa]
MADHGREAYCTLLMSDDYLPGAMVLGHSLRDNGTRKQLAVLITLDTVQASAVDELKTVYDHIVPVDRIVNRSPANLYLMNRPDLASTFTKIALWRQTQFKKIVYIDADVVALRAPDELFNSTNTFAAVPDIGWPDCFNSGVLALTPNMGDYYALLALAQKGISFDGADQGLLNMHFRDWNRLSFAYNCTPNGNYQYVPAYRHFQSTITMLHFIGDNKPWKIGRDRAGPTGVYEEQVGRWWAVYDKHYRVPITTYDPKESIRPANIVQQYVKGEDFNGDIPFSSISPSLKERQEPEAPTNTTETQLTDRIELAEGVHSGEVKPVPTVQQQRFSVDWDPIRTAPPTQSRPEAANFLSETYGMSQDRHLFQAPEQYPEPPQNMYYQVPKERQANDRPPPIFPWELNQSKATRVFAEDITPTPSAIHTENAPSMTTDDNSITEAASPSTPTVKISSPELDSFSRTNAWDDIPEIDSYISSLPQNHRAKVQAHFNHVPQQPSDPSITTTDDASITSPTTENPPSQPQSDRRRASLKITDFPTEIERPSLPVTPAPVRRPSFWGEERDSAGELPAAEGVPQNQNEWDPTTKLEELQRRQSEVLEKGPASPPRLMPQREMVGATTTTTVPGVPEGARIATLEEARALPTQPTPVPVFGTLNFAGGGGGDAVSAGDNAPLK